MSLIDYIRSDPKVAALLERERAKHLARMEQDRQAWESFIHAAARLRVRMDAERRLIGSAR